MRIHLITAIVTLLYLVEAGAMTVNGNLALLAASPVAVTSGALTSPDQAFAWAEQRDMRLPNPLAVDIIPFVNNAAGIYNSNKRRIKSSWSGDLATGKYNSVMLHADTPDNNKAIFTGFITFKEAIAGIIFKKSSLINTDLLLGASTTIYADSSEKRGFELSESKWFSISPGLRTFEFTTIARRHINEVRILTYAQPSLEPVPIPASIWLFSSALCLMTARARRC